MSKIPAAFLKAKSAHLKHWSFLTGLASTGTRAELTRRLLTATSLSNLQKSNHRRQRIVSVDMGIRNLAFCVVDLEVHSYSGRRRNQQAQSIGTVIPKVAHWKRMDLTAPNLHSASELSETSTNNHIEEEPGLLSSATGSRISQSKEKKAVASSDFTPPQLSKTAYLVTQELLGLNPDIILIERQRFRSGGAAAIQEWTVRVNMLESMLWACLETLRAQQQLNLTNTLSDANSTFPALHAVEPARVARFWLPGVDLPLQPPRDVADLFGLNSGIVPLPSKSIPNSNPKSRSSRNKVEKKDKVKLVKTWAGASGDLKVQASDRPGQLPNIKLLFEGQGLRIASAFRDSATKPFAKEAIAGGKLDDLADCLLQAVAWVRWEENKVKLQQLWKDFDDIV